MFGNEPFEDLRIEDYQQRFGEGTAHALIDVREVDEYLSGHLPGAVNLPLSSIQMRVDEIPKDQPVVLVCQTGGRSAMVAEWLASLGYSQLYNLADGTMGWRMRRLPLDTSA